MAIEEGLESVLYTVGHESGRRSDIVHFLYKEDMETYVHSILVPLHLEDDGLDPDDTTSMFAKYDKYGNYEVIVNIDSKTWIKSFKVTATERFIQYWYPACPARKGGASPPNETPPAMRAGSFHSRPIHARPANGCIDRARTGTELYTLPYNCTHLWELSMVSLCGSLHHPK